MAITITTTVVKQTLTKTTKMPKVAMATKQTTEITENQELSAQTVRHETKPTTSQRNVTLGLNIQ